MRKKLILIISLLLLLTGCSDGEEVLEKYTYNFFGTFDTVVQTVMYAKDQEEADKYNEYIEKRFNELHKEFNKYNNYDGINNVKTINDMAGKEAVRVSDELFDLIKESKELYYKYDKGTDISLGAVLDIWSDYREFNQDLEPGDNYTSEDLLPSMEELKEANKYTDIENIELDEENNTVFITDENTQIDVGATAKGYAVEIVGEEVRDMGMDSILISGGGNVKAIGKPKDGIRDKWGIGIQNPDILYPKEGESNIVETIFVSDLSVVTSGDYQRYFVVDGEVYHHLIDKDTLKPGHHHRAVTVTHPDSSVADFLSTAIFLMPYEDGVKLIESIDDAEAIWIELDENILTTEGMKDMMLSEGATGAK